MNNKIKKAGNDTADGVDIGNLNYYATTSGFNTNAGAVDERRQEATSTITAASSLSPNAANFLNWRPRKRTEAEKMRHRISNRKSGKVSRERRRLNFAKLSTALDTLTTQNISLRKVNSEWSDHIQDLQQQLRIAVEKVFQRQETMASIALQKIARKRLLSSPTNMSDAPPQTMGSDSTIEAEKPDTLLSTANLSEMLEADVILADPKDDSVPSCDGAARQDTSVTAGFTSVPISNTNRSTVVEPSKTQATVAEKKMRRIMGNRVSGKKSRERRQQKMDMLTAEMDMLTAGNRAMRKLNAELTNDVRAMKKQLRLALDEVQTLLQEDMVREAEVNTSFTQTSPHFRFPQGYSFPRQQQTPPPPNLRQTNQRYSNNRPEESWMENELE